MVTTSLNRFALVSSFAATLAGFTACDAPAPVAAPALPPAIGLMQEVPASAHSTEVTGVTSWKVYADTGYPDSTLVFGVDASGTVVTESRIGGDLATARDGAAVAMESLYPEAGTFRLGADGNLVSSDLSPAAAAVFASLGADFKADADADAMSESPGARTSWRCIRAGVILGGACGVTIAGCLETVGLGCAVGGALCVAAYQDWLCECHHRCY